MKRRFLLTGFISLTLLVNLTSFSPRNGSGLVDDVLGQTNKFRKSHRLEVLIMNNDLNAIAQKHSENMAKGRVGFGHSGFNRRFSQASRSITGMKTFAENVAYGASSGKEVVTMWKNSSEHRRNMLGRYRYIGIGTATDRRGMIYYTQVFAN